MKLLFQVQAVKGEGQAYTGMVQAFRKVFGEEGALSFWKVRFIVARAGSSTGKAHYESSV